MARMEYIRSLPIEIRRRKTCVMMDILAATANKDDGHWVFCSMAGKVALQASQCLACGGYTMTANPDVYLNISRNALCSCDGFMDYYLDNVYKILEWDRQEAMKQSEDEDTEDTEDEEDNYDVDDYHDF